MALSKKNNKSRYFKNVMKSNKAINISNEVISQCHPGNGMYNTANVSFCFDDIRNASSFLFYACPLNSLLSINVED